MCLGRLPAAELRRSGWPSSKRRKRSAWRKVVTETAAVFLLRLGISLSVEKGRELVKLL